MSAFVFQKVVQNGGYEVVISFLYHDETCGRKTTITSLMETERSHAAYKTFLCPICSRSQTDLSYRYTHEGQRI